MVLEIMDFQNIILDLEITFLNLMKIKNFSLYFWGYDCNRFSSPWYAEFSVFA